MKRRKWIAVLMAVVLVLQILPAGTFASTNPGTVPLARRNGITVPISGTEKAVFVQRPKEIPADWIVVKAEGVIATDKEGHIVTHVTVLYKDPKEMPHPCINGAFLCSWWERGALSDIWTVGGISEHMITYFDRHHWLGEAGGSAWLLWDSVVWWTRGDSTWGISATRLESEPIYGAKDCYGDHQAYPAKTLWIYPDWNGYTTPHYVLYTDDQGTLATKWPTRQHWVYPVTVYHNWEYYSQIQRHIHWFSTTGYGGS